MGHGLQDCTPLCYAIRSVLVLSVLSVSCFARKWMCTIFTFIFTFIMLNVGEASYLLYTIIINK